MLLAVLNAPRIKWMACRASNCLVHLRKCQAQPLEVRSLAEAEQASRNAARRAKRNGAQLPCTPTVHDLPLPGGHAPEPYNAQNPVPESLPTGEPPPLSYTSSAVYPLVGNAVLPVHNTVYPNTAAFPEQNTDLRYTQSAPYTMYMPQTWTNAHYALPYRHMVPSFDGTYVRGVVSTLPLIYPTSSLIGTPACHQIEALCRMQSVHTH